MIQNCSNFSREKSIILMPMVPPWKTKIFVKKHQGSPLGKMNIFFFKIQETNDAVFIFSSKLANFENFSSKFEKKISGHKRVK
jgi:hypothetical protein